MKINVTRSSMPSYEEYCEEIRELWDSHWLTNMGEKHKRLESGLKDYFKAQNIRLYTNGHLALEMLITAMAFPKGGEVITTPFTFASTTNAIIRNGLVPVFCDISPEDYTIDASKIEELINEKTVAILPVHVYGSVCDVYKIDAIAKKHGLKVIYDAAHAFGVEYNGESVANFGDGSMFSFHATKVFNTIEGGAVTYKDEALGVLLDELKNFTLNQDEGSLLVGGNAKMNEFQASMGICNLRHVDSEIEKRRRATLHYRKRLEGVSGIRLLPEQAGVKHNYSYLPVVFDGYKYSRDEVAERLLSAGILARKYFYPLISELPNVRAYCESVAETPIAKHIADRVLTLPLYADLTNEDIDTICQIILN